MDQQFQTPPSNQTQNLPPQDFSQPNETVKSKKFGPIIAILVVILVVVIVALYLLASSNGVKTFGGTQDSCIAGATDCIDVSGVYGDENTDKVQLAPQQGANVTDSVPSNGTVAPITNPNDDLNSLQADLDASINGIDAQTI